MNITELPLAPSDLIEGMPCPRCIGAVVARSWTFGDYLECEGCGAIKFHPHPTKWPDAKSESKDD